MTVHDFSFRAHAGAFDQHINDSIPGLDTLRAATVTLSRDFVQMGTRVVDIGCSTGVVLQSVRDANEPSRRSRPLHRHRHGAQIPRAMA